MTKICQKAWVIGTVQGVFFRATTQQKARILGLTGYAKNLSDGRVEVLACGEQQAVKELLLFLQQGPIQSKVDSVKTESVDFVSLSEFEVL
jgi:acylphosphatase